MACSSRGVIYDYDRSADFSSDQTYSWIEGTSSRDEVPLEHVRIVKAVERELVAKGKGL